MKLSTRLLLPLLAVVAAVMLLYAMWALRQRERTLREEARREVEAYSTALGLALESAFRDPYMKDVQEIIDRVSRERTVYGVIVYAQDGGMLFLTDLLRPDHSAPDSLIGAVLTSGATSALEREIDEQPVYSIVRAIKDPIGGVVGALEVAQPLSFLQAELARTRQRFLLNTLTLLAAVTIVILALVRHLIAKPLGSVVAGARAIGRGELAYRIEMRPDRGELAALANEFNRMAGHLEGAQAEIVREGEERLTLERKLREAEKLAAIGNLAAGVAHEIGAPLHVIRGRTEMLIRREMDAPSQQRNLRIIVEQISRITVIVRNLLDYARRREPKLEPMDLVTVIRGVAEFLEWEMGRAGVVLDLSLPATLVVRGDPNLLHQVFINLLMNALQAVQHIEKDAHRITVRATHVDTPNGRGAWRVGGDASEAGQVVVEVSDTGPGIPPDVLPSIFEPFFTTKIGEGTGLGLPVARSIVEEHGGRLEAGNVIDHDDAAGARTRGALFRLILPAAVVETVDA
jgi:signal transduction histidine kinase